MVGFLKVLFLILISLAIGGALVYGVAKVKPDFLGLPKDATQTQEDVQKLVAEVGKLIQLPTDETPTVATITDIEKVKEQAFFKNAQNGDKVLIYTNAKKAILYRPSEKKVVEVGAVNINQQPKVETTPEPVVTPTPIVSPSPVATASPIAQ